MKKNKKKIIIGIISILIIILLIVGILIFLKPKKELNENKNSKHQATQATIELIDNLEVEINSEVNLLSFIKNNNNLEIVSNDEKVDTSILGEKELIIKYKEQNEEKEYKFNIKIKDTIAPSIEYKEELSTTVGTKIDLLKDVKVSDNSLEEIKATVEGKYDIDKEGTYNLKYVAVDSSNNRVEEEFTLKVNKKTAKKTTTSKSNTPSSSKKPAENINPDKEWVDFDLATEYGETTDYKYGTKLSEVKEYFILKYSDNTEEKVYAGSTYKIDSKNYNGNTKVLLSEATAIVDRNLSVQNEMLKYVNDYRAEKGAEPLSIDRN